MNETTWGEGDIPKFKKKNAVSSKYFTLINFLMKSIYQ